jgi:hypothetical protein
MEGVAEGVDRGESPALHVVFVAGLIGIASAEFIASSWGARTPILQLPAALIALPLPTGMGLLALYALTNLRREHAANLWGVGIGLVSVLVAAHATRGHWLPWLGGDGAIVVALGLFLTPWMCVSGSSRQRGHRPIRPATPLRP